MRCGSAICSAVCLIDDRVRGAAAVAGAGDAPQVAALLDDEQAIVALYLPGDELGQLLQCERHHVIVPSPCRGRRFVRASGYADRRRCRFSARYASVRRRRRPSRPPPFRRSRGAPAPAAAHVRRKQCGRPASPRSRWRAAPRRRRKAASAAPSPGRHRAGSCITSGCAVAVPGCPATSSPGLGTTTSTSCCRGHLAALTVAHQQSQAMGAGGQWRFRQ